MFNLINKGRLLAIAMIAVGIVACEKDDVYTIPESNVEVVVPREEIIVVSEITLSTANPYVLEGITTPVTVTAAAPANVSKVAFYNGETLLGEDNAAPFTQEVDVSGTTAFNNMVITAVGFSQGVEAGEADLVLSIGKRFRISGGTLTGVIATNPNDPAVERWNTDGPTTPPFPSDGRYPGFLNWDGGGNLEVASGVNLPVAVPETGEYIAALGMASGWAGAESFLNLYFDDKVGNVQRSEAVPPNGWISFDTYFMPEPYTLAEGEHMAKIRFGGPYVHPYYLDLYKAVEVEE